MPATDYYEVKLKTQLLGQTCLNIFHFYQSLGTNNADNLADAFETDYVAAIKAAVSSQVAFKTIEVKNLNNASDFYVKTITGNGSVSGDCLPPQDAWSFTQSTTRTDTKSGGKRFSGVSETLLGNNIVNFAGQIVLNALEAQLSRNLVVGGDTWLLRIKGVRRGVLGQYFSSVSTASFKGAFTQNTRKSYTAGLF